MVGICGVPCQISPCWAFQQRAYSIHPSVARNEITAGVAYNWQVQTAERCHYICAQPVLVSKRRIWFVNATIDAPSQVLGKPTEDIALNST